MRESDIWVRNLPVEDITLQGIILAFVAFIGSQTYRMNGCIKRIEGKIEGLKNGSG